MKFEVINSNGHVVMWTESLQCIPTPEELALMSMAGYRYKVDAKLTAYNKVEDAVSKTFSGISSTKKLKPNTLF